MKTTHDYLVPFLINESPVRGRVVRLTDVVNAVVTRHHYPEIVARMLAEAVAVAAMLAANLKSDGIFTLQVQGKGAINLLVVDATHGGAIRGYADYDAERLDALESKSLHGLFGQDGVMIITFDPGEKGQRYQGIVPLEGRHLTDAVHAYFAQSQQILARFKVAVGEQVIAGEPRMRWLAGGIYIEQLGQDNTAMDEDSEAWRHAMALISTVKDEELLDVDLELKQLLFNLFHESGVWAYDPMIFSADCRCSRDKMLQTLRGFAPDVQESMVQNGIIEVNCRFCNSTQTFALADIRVEKA